MSTNQILTTGTQITASGVSQKPNGIVQIQQPQQSGAWVLCDDGTVTVNGSVVFNPPLPVADSSKIFSPDLSSQIQCVNGGTIQVTGTIDGYSTTAQTNSNISGAIADLSTVYMPISQTLDEISTLNPATAGINANQQIIYNVSDPTDLQDVVNLQYLQNNYNDTQQEAANISAAVDALSSVYMPIDQTLNQIATDNLTSGSVDLNNQKIINLANGVDPNDAVNFSQLSGYIPTTGNINSLSAQTANYDTSSYQITVSSAPTIGNDLTNKTYVDGQISTRYANTTPLSSITIPTASVNFNSQKAINLLNPTQNQDAVTLGYIQTFYATLTYISANFFTQGYIIANYLTQASAAATYATVAMLSSYVTNSALTSTLANYTLLQTFNDTVATLVTSAFLSANYYTASFINSTFASLIYLNGNFYTKSVSDSTFALISSLSSYVLQSSLTNQLSGYLTIVSASSTYQTLAAMSSYITSTQLATSLTAYVQTSALASYLTQIQSTSTAKSKVNCSSASQIVLTVNDVDKGYFYSPTGQSTQPLGLLATDKLQFQSNLNSFSFYGGKALQNTPTQNYNSVYINSSDDVTKNVGFQLSLGGTSALTQECVLSTGHTLLGGNQVPYSALSNNSTSPQYNMQISGGTPQTDQTLTLYSDYYAGILGYNLTAQYNKKVGYSTTTSITEPNQFPSKTWVDSSISALSSVYQTIANMSLYYTKTATDTLLSSYALISSIYTQTQSNARFVLQTTPLQSILSPTGNLAMANNRITGMADGINPTDAATVQQIVSGGGLTKAQADTYYMGIGTTLNNIPLAQGNVSINTQKITDLVAGTNNTDAVNLLQMTNAIALRTPFKTATISTGTIRTATSDANITLQGGSFSSTGNFITSVLCRSNTGICGQILTINYTNQGTIPMIIVTAECPTILTPIGTGIVAFVFGPNSATQATVLITCPSQTNSTQLQNANYSVRMLFINPSSYPV